MPIGTPERSLAEPGLERLLAFESELGARLAAAREEAERIRRGAEIARVEDRARLAAALQAEEAALADQLTARRHEEVQRIRAEAGARVARLGSLEDTRVDLLARWVLSRMLDGDATGTPR